METILGERGDTNDYVLEIVVRDRIAELRAEAERGHRFEADRSVSTRVRGTVSRALIRMQSRIVRGGRDTLSEVRP